MEKIENEKIYKIILAIFGTISISIVTLFCFFCIGLSKVEAKLDINFIDSERLRNITGSSAISLGTELNYCTNDWGCNIPSSNIFTQKGMVTNYTRVDSNVASENYLFLSGHSYTINFSYTIYKTEDTTTSLKPSMAILNTSGTWVLATCDSGQTVQNGTYYEVNTEYGTTYRQEYIYKCNTLNSTINGNSFRTAIITTDNFSGSKYWSTFLILTDNERPGNSAEEIINNDNVNTDKIINNQNQNTDKITDAIEGEGLEDTTPIDPNKKNELEEVEEELLKEDVITSLNDIDISIDTNSNEFIWNLVTRIINTNSLIFGLVLTMLSLGVLKLVLNR